MNAGRYSLGLRFAAIFDSEHRYDIVHDALVYYYNKTGRWLLDEKLTNESQFMYTVIKKSFYRWLYKEGHAYEYKGVRRTFTAVDGLLSDNESPEEYTDANLLINMLTPKQQKVAKLLMLGHKQQDVAEILGVSKQLVHSYRQSIKQRLN